MRLGIQTTQRSFTNSNFALCRVLGFVFTLIATDVYTYTIEVYGKLETLLTTTVIVDNRQIDIRPNFFGVASNSGIDGLRIFTPGLEFVGIDNITFGVPVPEPASITLALCIASICYYSRAGGK